jgi:Xaa-Pro aminopeptidase
MLKTYPQAERLAHLRDQLATQGLDGFVVPLTDEHMSEYVGGYAKRLEWLTGFNGSAGAAVVLKASAAIFVDGRYTIQVRDQVDGRLFAYQLIPDTSVAQWLAETVSPGARIGYDPWFHTLPWAKATRAALARKSASLEAVSANPVDAIWHGRPSPSLAPIVPHPDVYAGQTAADKRTAVAAAVKSAGADVAVISALDSVAWLFNVRGSDVERTPVPRAYATLTAEGVATLFAEPEKITPALQAHLGADVVIAARADFLPTLAKIGAAGQSVLVDPETTVAAVFEALETAKATIIEARDPCILPKARKNPVEMDGTRAAHRRDGAAVTRLLHWLAIEAPKGTVTELDIVDRVYGFRADSNLLRDASFDTIAGAGPNGAITHYRVTPDTCRTVAPDDIVLIDSGGQYLDGTTDITRTVAIGAPLLEHRERFTRVLQGHIALARARFPKGTTGQALDALARLPLWQAGLDYDHGTGHGVGSFLSVHEGPQRIAKAGTGVSLEPGMILSNEPGYYKTGAYGFRIENLVLVVEDKRPGDERDMLALETLTLAPIDRNLIDPSLLTGIEREWLNSYHARVFAELAPQMPEDARHWLESATAPIAQGV